jgi:hypothetical protein
MSEIPKDRAQGSRFEKRFYFFHTDPLTFNPPTPQMGGFEINELRMKNNRIGKQEFKKTSAF